MFEKMRNKLRAASRADKPKNMAVFVDGPNILRKEFNIDLSQVKRSVSKFGKIKIGRVFLNQYASTKLVEAVVNQGFESIITVGDIDVSMAADAVEAIYNPAIDAIVFVTRDSDFLPAIVKAKRNGKETIVVLVEEASAASLKNNADHVVFLKKAEVKK
ncbi:MAG: TIGR00288 family NYN domain-containing protein [archaeon]|nr:TIGR00288 family NYN domain-containing protein [archaeon]